MRVAILDTLYPPVIEALPVDPSSTYEAELQRVLSFSFSTSDFYSRGLRAHGLESIDIIGNHSGLQKMWARENGRGSSNPKAIAVQQIREFDPQVLLLQDASFFSPSELEFLSTRHFLAAQISCPMPREENVRLLDLVATSFPHYLPRFEAMGVKAVFNPLGFDEVVLERMGPTSGERSGVVFVGGVGGPNSHWRYGTETLEHIAAEIGGQFRWYGYGIENLSASSPLRKSYRGQSWGLDAYKRMAEALITVNRHGEVAENFANNQRLFECTGIGSLLLTDAKSNLGDYFTDSECVSYSSPSDAVEKIRYYLAHPEEAQEIAEAGQRRTLAQHTYLLRMKIISDTLKEALVAA